MSIYTTILSADTIYRNGVEINNYISFYDEDIVLLSGGSWDSTAYTQTVGITSTTLSDSSTIWVSPNPVRANVTNYSNANIIAVSNSTTGVTFECETIPTSNIDINLTIKKL